MRYERPQITGLASAIRGIQSSKSSGIPDNQCPGRPDNDLPTGCSYQSDE
jgi:hypothetical protein